MQVIVVFIVLVSMVVLDGLMLVDLTEVPTTMLVRFMGKSEAADFCHYHADQGSTRVRARLEVIPGPIVSSTAR